MVYPRRSHQTSAVIFHKRNLVSWFISFSALTFNAVLANENANVSAEPPINEPIPTVVVIGHRERLPDIAGSAALLEQQELKQSRVLTINEALRKVPGVHVRDEEGIGIRPNIGVRGLNPTRSTKVLLLEDGLPLAYAPYGDNASYYHPPIERYNRVEVLKGSEQILFGPQTIGGVINYVTPTPPDEFGGNVLLSGGSREYFNGHFSLGGRGVLFDVMHKRAKGARDNEDSKLIDVNLKSLITLTERQALTLKVNFYEEDSLVSYSGITDAELRNFGYRYNPFVNDEFDTERVGLSASHEFALSAALTVATNLYITHFDRDWWRQASTTTDGQCGNAFRDSRLAGNQIDPLRCNSTQGRLRSYYTYGIEPRLLAEFSFGGFEHEFQGGVRAHFETQDRNQENGAAARARTGTLVENNERNVNAYSFFLQNRTFVGAFSLTPGVRVEYAENERVNNLTGGVGNKDLAAFIPGFGITYNPLETFTLFGGVHKGFAPPRTEDLIVTPTGAPLATFTEVDVEESVNAEFGLRSQIRSGARFDATLFRNNFDNQIQVGSIAGGTTPLAQGETLYEGLELFTRWDTSQLFATRHNWFLQTTYTFLPTADQETPVIEVANNRVVAGSRAGNRLPYAPRHLVTTSIGFTHISGFDLRLEAVHTAEQFSDFANTENAPLNGNGQTGVIKSTTLLNLAASYSLEHYGATVFLTAKNLTDRDYIADRTRGIRVGMPLLVFGGIELAF